MPQGRTFAILLYNTHFYVAQHRFVLLLYRNRANNINVMAIRCILFAIESNEVYGKCSILNSSTTNTKNDQLSCP